MRAAILVLALAIPAGLGASCGDNRPGDEIVDARPRRDAGADALTGGTLFGEPCEQPAFPEIGTCHLGEGACHDEPEGPVCRPWCHVAGVPRCMALGGIERVTDRGACVCVPP